MTKLTDFANICRLCLTKHYDRSVNLFSKQKVYKNTPETSDFYVVEEVRSFCDIKIRKDDGLPEYICNICWNVVVTMKKLQTVSVKSDRLLNKILGSHSSAEAVKKSNEAVKDVEPSNNILDLQIEFIDTRSNVEKERFVESDDSTPAMEPTKTEPSDDKSNNKRGGKRKYSEKKISCEMCGKLVITSLIDYHLNVHKDIRPYKCKADDCEKHFTSPAHERQHYRKVHSNTRPHKCDVCGRGFVQTSSLATHRSYHFDPQIPCSICGQLYRNKRALQKHFLVHSGERKYSCSECKKSFQTSFTLKTHMRIRTLEKPFSCSECTKTFAYKCLLKAHIEKYHPKEGG